MKKHNYTPEQLKSVAYVDGQLLNGLPEDQLVVPEEAYDAVMAAEAIVFDALSSALSDVRRNNPGAPAQFLEQQAVLYERYRSVD